MTLRARILCRVVDNFGDAGVCWRLARQLRAEHGWHVSLTIDRPEVLARLGAHATEGLRIEHWPVDGALQEADDDVLISAFGAEPPPRLRASLAGRARRPLWIDLEYLSAEDWVAGCHGLRSEKPFDGAVEHYFYPGYDERSGGLLRERDLCARRDAFVGSTAQREWLRARGIEPAPGERLATLFCYPDAPLAAWFDRLADGPVRWRVVVPEGVADAALAAFLGVSPPAGRTLGRGALAVQRIAFQTQDDYDRLLWSAELNFVRGEDSWVRAQWAARPFVWQPYTQSGETHRIKLRAFLERMQAGPVVDAAMLAWAGDGRIEDAWPRFEAALPAYAARCRAWSRQLAAQTDLATRLVSFCRERL